MGKYSCNILKKRTYNGEDRKKEKLSGIDRKGKMVMAGFGNVAAILIVCFLVLFIGAFGRKIEWIINFVLRAVMGTIGIYLINGFLIARNISVAVGINPLTVLTSGILGFPGLVVLYGINFFKTL